MNSNRRRWTRRIAAAVLALGLGLTAVSGTVRAQDGEGEPSEGRTLDGYAATCILATLALVIICKSARR